MDIAAVIFDCDGVLINSEELGIVIERRALAAIGLDYEREDYVTRFIGMTDEAWLRALGEDRRAQLGEGLPAGFVATMETERRRVYATELRPVAGISDLVGSLTLPKAVASSARVEALARHLQLTELHDLFSPHIYSAEQVDRGKPAPDIFLFAAERLDCRASDCLVVEDSVNGVRAGVAAGMTVWGFTGGGHADPGMADRLQAAGAHLVFPDFATLGAQLG